MMVNAINNRAGSCFSVCLKVAHRHTDTDTDTHTHTHTYTLTHTHQLWALPALVVGEEAEALGAESFQEDHAGRRAPVSAHTNGNEAVNNGKQVYDNFERRQRYLLGGRGDTHSVGLPDPGALCGLIEPVAELLDRVKRDQLTLLKALQAQENPEKPEEHVQGSSTLLEDFNFMLLTQR